MIVGRCSFLQADRAKGTGTEDLSMRKPSLQHLNLTEPASSMDLIELVYDAFGIALESSVEFVVI